MLVCHGRTIEPKLGRLSRWLSLALLSRKMLWWHFTHCVSALGVPWRGFIPEQSSSENRECWNRGQLLNPPPLRAQRVTVTKLSLPCRVPTSNPSTFQPGQWMAWQALAAPIKSALCQIISGKEPLDPVWFSSTQLQWLSWFWCQPGQGQLKPIRSSQLHEHHPVSADEKSSLGLARP